MKISLLVPDLSCYYGNCMSRAYLLAKILQRSYEVEVVGPMLGDEIWQPIAQLGDLCYKPVAMKGSSTKKIKDLKNKIQEVLELVEGDVVYASKPLLSSFGLGLLLKIQQKKPVLLDMDDWQMGFRKETYKNLSFQRKIKDLTDSAWFLFKTSSYWNNYLGEKISGFADEITVSNRFLQNKFGGTIIRHAENTELFNPEKFDSQQVRQKLGIPANKKVVMFCGTPRSHKGVEELVEAIALLPDPDILLTIVGNDGGDYSAKFTQKAEKKLSDRFQTFGLQPYTQVPEYLSIADIVVIPQRNNFATQGQVPIKVFDAMAMAKPIIASAVSDLPEILNECGWIVPPENPQALAATIRQVFDAPQAAFSAGEKARQKCVEEYSWDAVEKILHAIFQKYE